jgi:hypothetical protein
MANGRVLDGALGHAQLVGVVVEVVVVATVGSLSGPDVVVVGGTEVVVVVAEVVVVVGGTEVVVADVAVVVAVVVLVPEAVVVVEATTAAPTLSGGDTPNKPDELSVTSSTVVPGSKRVTLTVATPPVKVTLLLPALQSP